MKSSQPSLSKRETMKHVKDESTEEYVVIDPFHSEKKMKLTDHQKEKLMGRRLEGCRCQLRNIKKSILEYLLVSVTACCFLLEKVNQSIWQHVFHRDMWMVHHRKSLFCSENSSFQIQMEYECVFI